MKRLETLTRCAVIVAAHFKECPMRVMSHKTYRADSLTMARTAMWHHCRKCGMSWEAIARLFGRSIAGVQRNTLQRMIRMKVEDMQMIQSLPMIPNSLDLRNAKGMAAGVAVPHLKSD